MLSRLAQHSCAAGVPAMECRLDLLPSSFPTPALLSCCARLCRSTALSEVEEQERHLRRWGSAPLWDTPMQASPTWGLHSTALDEGVRMEGVRENMSSVRTVYSLVDEVSVPPPCKLWRWYWGERIERSCHTQHTALSCDTQLCHMTHRSFM